MKISISAQVREENFGYPQESSYTHIALTRIPTIRHDPVIVPVTQRIHGVYWSEPTTGRSGYWVTYSAELPEEFHGLAVFDDRVDEGGYVAELIDL